MKKHLLSALALGLSLSTSFAQGWFDNVTYKGAFPVSGSTRNATAGFTGYNPDASFTDANWAKTVQNGGWVQWDPQNDATYPSAATSTFDFTLSGDIANNTAVSGKVLLKGTVHVLSGATLTIAAGTKIVGDLSNTGVLIVSPGGKINAVGTSSNPIVMTSGKPVGQRKAGDWGGLLLIGRSTINSGVSGTGTRPYEALPTDPLAVYGGTNEFDNSGTLRYVRVEFAGYNFLPDQEINGITFAACGSQTQADYLQVSYTRDDSYEWFGGTSNHKYLISFASVDDEYDMDEGYRGKLQHLLAVRRPDVYETSAGGTSNSFEHDNNTNGNTPSAVNTSVNDPQPATAPIISNATIYGPTQNGNALISGHKFGRALEIRTNAATSLYNSIVLGFPTLFQTGNPAAGFVPSVQRKLVDGTNVITNNYFAPYTAGSISTTAFAFAGTPTTLNINGIVGASLTSANGLTWLTNPYSLTGTQGLGNFSATNDGNSITNLLFSVAGNNTFTTNDFTLQSTSPAATGGSFTDAKIAALTSVATPSITFPTALAPFNVLVGNTATASVTVNYSNITSTGFTLAAPANFTLSGTSFTVTTGTGSFAFTITYGRDVEGSDNGVITINNSQLSAASINVIGYAVAPAKPILNIDRGSVDFTAASSSDVKWFNVNGTFLTASVTVTGNSAFAVSTSSTTGFASSVVLPVTNGSIATRVFVQYATANNSTESVTLTVAGLGLNNTAATRFVNANANTAPMVTFSVEDLPNNQTAIAPLTQFGLNTVTGWYSYAYPITITAVNIPASGLEIARANATFEIALAGTSGITNAATTGFAGTQTITGLGSSFTTVILVRLNANITGFNNRTPALRFNVNGTNVKSLNIGGTAVATPTTTGIVVKYRNGLSFSSLNGGPSAAQEVPFYAQNTSSSVLNLNVVANSLFELSTSASGPWSSFPDLTTNGLNFAMMTSPGLGYSTVAGSVFVRFNPNNANSTISGNTVSNNLVAVSADLIFNFVGSAISTSISATNVALALRGNYGPEIKINPLTLPQFNGFVNTPTSSAPVRVTGERVVAPVVFNAPAGFEVSASATTGFASSVSLAANSVTGVFDQTFYVRYNGTSTNVTSGTISLSNPNAPSQSIIVSGVAINAPSPILSFTTSATTVTLSGLSAIVATLTGSQLTALVVTTPSALVASLSSTTGYSNSLSISTGTIIGTVGTTNYFNIATTPVYIRAANYTVASGLTIGKITATSGSNSQSIDLGYVVTSVEDEFEANAVKTVIYPNPTSGSFFIGLDGLEVASVTVYSAFGELVYAANLASGVNEVKTSLNKGLYIVKIASNGKFVAKKLIVQ
jgi:hypothetical protein